MPEQLLASQLYAISEGSRCAGPDRCHWCGAACERWWLHDDPPPVLGKKRDPLTRCPANHYVCTGCFFWRKPRITVTFLSGGFKDVQCPKNHSWWITDNGALAVRWDQSEGALADRAKLYDLLLKPPCRFALLLRQGDGVANLLHAGKANENAIVGAQTEMFFTLNNVLHSYSVYELEQAIRYGVDGRPAGVRELMNFLGPCHQKERILKEMEPKHEREEGKAGRPVMGDSEEQLAVAATRKVLTRSGVDPHALAMKVA